ncbi:MAG: hypothetical protein RBG13Loki_4068 [Promethearchaeota archaeon CR_4]|nr:MAG: hypothetical protein RBG13Loki_4068 [Candidatus Lokiarchaeota archaeon CR_4]
MPRCLPLWLVACLFCASIFAIQGYAFEENYLFNQHSIHSTQGVTPTYVNVTLNTTEIFADSSESLGFYIMSDGDGIVVVNITSAENAIAPVLNRNLAFMTGIQIYGIPISPAWGALPGSFSVQVSAWYLNATNDDSMDLVFSESVTVTITLGLTLGVPIVLGIIAVVVIIFVKVAKSAGSKKPKTGKAKVPTKIVPSGVAGKILCPECKKTIDEGSVFCAECGARVPEFLRYNESET